MKKLDPRTTPAPALRRVIDEELLKMLARQLDNAPAAEDLPLIQEMMYQDLRHHGLLDRDAGRVRAALQHLGPLISRWPTSRDVLGSLPRLETYRKLPGKPREYYKRRFLEVGAPALAEAKRKLSA